jgi:hypothetical protein
MVQNETKLSQNDHKFGQNGPLWLQEKEKFATYLTISVAKENFNFNSGSPADLYCKI